MTRYAAPISLFTPIAIAPRASSSFALSALAHVAAGGMLCFVLTHLPAIEDRTLLERYSVRQLDLHTLDSAAPAKTENEQKIPYPGASSTHPMLPPELMEAMRSFLDLNTGTQTLIQPEFQTHLPFADKAPLPSIIIWTAELAPGRRIVAPLPHPATASNVAPSLDLPNQEIRLASLGVAATDRPARTEAVPRGTTSPIETHSTRLLEMAPSTISDSAEQPSPTAVLSLSDVRMQDGTILLPPVNEVAAGAEKPGAPGDRNAGAGSGRFQSQSPSSAPDAAEESLTTEHIILPKDGRFGVVVVGSSLAEEYPETIDVWTNRIAYTAYLHVGLSKTWILQYSVTRSSEAADAGTVGRLEAPWPYDILRPNIASRDLNANALMIHGFLNQAGRFESLAMAFPAGFRYASFLLHVLRQWQFRPAMQNGHAAAVEILLVIPAEFE